VSSLAKKLVPEVVEKLIPYQSARRIGGQGHLWLNANELERGCQYGQLSQGCTDNYNRYPDFLPHQLAEQYQRYCELSAGDLTCETVAVRGADEAIDLLIRTFCQPGNDQILICPPTYAMYEFCADAFAVKTVKVALLDDFQLDVAAIKPQLAKSSLLFLCSPNNPTGNLIHQRDIVELLEASKDSTLVVVDEAYIEFSPADTVLSLMTQYPNLIVIRTMSKAFGLASIRCGFLMAAPQVMAYVARLIAPYPIADPTATIALQALTEQAVLQMQSHTEQLVEVRDWFSQQLQQLAIVDIVYRSATNFVLIKFNSDNSIYDFLLSKGIVTRNQAHEAKLERCVRISIGTKSSMVETLAALQSY